MQKLNKYKVNLEDLRVNNPLATIQFESTEDIPVSDEIIGQDRAVLAINFGLKMKHSGYNIFVAGPSGVGKSSYTKSLIKKSFTQNTNVKDWVYVNNFNNQNEPISISLIPGEGKLFKKDIEDVIEKLKLEIPKIFISKEYEYHSKSLMKELEENIQCIIVELNEFANPKGFKFQVTERGLISIPLKEDKSLMKEEELSAMTAVQIQELRDRGLKLNEESKEYLDKIKLCEESYKNKSLDLDKNVGKSLVGFYGQMLLRRYGKNEKINNYINSLCNDIVNNISIFKKDEENTSQNPMAMLGLLNRKNDDKKFEKYKVNLFIDNSQCRECKIIEENNPTYYNLTGSIEYKNEIGALTTSFMELKPGALHKANGGYLILNIKDILVNPFAWDCLKRTLKTEKISIESLNKQHGYVVTSTLKPEPIDLDIKVILIGDNYYYSMMYAYEEDFRSLFKVMADFDIDLKNNEKNIFKTVQLIANKCRDYNLKHFEKEAVEKLIEYSVRISDNKDKLTARFDKLIDIVFESEALSDPSNKYVTKKDVENSIAQKRYRSNKYEEKLNEMFEEGSLLIDIDGEKVGQINGLAVMGTGEYSFGKPSKITASSYKGRSGIINIEREIKQSGRIHDKGVLILSGYLGARYGKEKPLSISTSITFEQNYSGVDGDSASSTELYAIISSIADIPIKQSIAVTGSVSQKGEIQPIGGVNEKIEGFFDVCKIKGLSGEQGVIIPIQNVKNLVLKDEVINSIRENKFTIYAISSIEEGLKILTGKDINEIDKIVNYTLDKYRKLDKDNEIKDK